MKTRPQSAKKITQRKGRPKYSENSEKYAGQSQLISSYLVLKSGFALGHKQNEI